MLNYIYSLNCKKSLIQVTTNGARLSDHTARLLKGHLKSLTISLNAAAAETDNKQMKNGDFEKTLLAIRRFLSSLGEKERLKINLYFVAHTENFQEIPDFVVLEHDLGIPAVTIAHYQVGIAEHRQFRKRLEKPDSLLNWAEGNRPRPGLLPLAAVRRFPGRLL